MSDLIVLLHEKSLRIPDAVVDRLEKDTRVIYVWDDAYYKNRGYSLKRLVFIYETSRSFNVEIVRDDLFCGEDFSFETKRFFKYWKKAEKTVFLRDGRK